MEAEKDRTNPASSTTAGIAAPQQDGSQSSGTQKPVAGTQGDSLTDAMPDERRRKVAEAAYYRAERRGFAPGAEDSDWLEAEREIGGWQGSIKVEELDSA